MADKVGPRVCRRKEDLNITIKTTVVPFGRMQLSIDEQVAQQLKLPVIDVVTIASASHAKAEQNVYPIQIEVVGLPVTVNASRSIGAPLKPQGICVLIGRAASPRRSDRLHAPA